MKLLQQKKLLRIWPRAVAVAAVSGALFVVAVGCGSKPSSAPTDAVRGGEPVRVSRIEVIQPGPVPHAISRAESGWHFTSSHQWGYAAFVPFDAFGRQDVKGSVEIKVRGASGKLGIGLITDQGAVINEHLVDMTQAEQSVNLPLGTANLQSLVFRSAAPSGTTTDGVIQAVDYILRAQGLGGAVQLTHITKVDPAASLETGPPVRVVAGQKYAFAAQIPVAFAGTGNSPVFIRVHARIVKGRVGLGILEKSNVVAKGEHFYDASPSAIDYFVAVPRPDAAIGLLFRSDTNEKSEIDIEDVTAFQIV